MTKDIALLLLPALMMLAAATDIASFRIPNWLTGLTAALFFPAAWLYGMPSAELLLHVKAGAILFFAGYVMFALRLLGGGDAKLMAAAGLWFGMTDMMPFLFLTALAGGVLALVHVIWALAAQDAGPGLTMRQKIKAMTPKLPYGCALAAGAILAFPSTWWAEAGTHAAAIAG